VPFLVIIEATTARCQEIVPIVGDSNRLHFPAHEHVGLDVPGDIFHGRDRRDHQLHGLVLGQGDGEALLELPGVLALL
jgi:hypothetical protein